MKIYQFIFIAFILVFSVTAEKKEILFTYKGSELELEAIPLSKYGIDLQAYRVSFRDIDILLPPGKYEVIDEVEKTGRLFLNVNGEKRLSGLKLHFDFKDDKKIIIDPFKGLKPEDMKFVRGVTLDEAVNPNIINLLKHADYKYLFLNVTDESDGDKNGLPAMSPKLQFLKIDSSSSDSFSDFINLKKLNNLKYLNIDLVGDEFSAAEIAGNKGLRYLDTGSINDWKDLNKLTELRKLFLSYSDITDIKFVSSMKQLQELSVNKTKVSDLSPLSGLQKIEFVNANSAPVNKLPGAELKSLKTLKVLKNELDKVTIDLFRKKNPLCNVLSDWNETLAGSLKNTTRVKIRTGGTCHTNPDREKMLFELKDKAEIRELIKNIKVDSSKSGFHCMCCGSPSFEFYQGQTLLLTLGFHHGSGMRWHRGDWPGDGKLTKKSADYICLLLDKHGVKGPLSEKREEQKRQNAARKRWKLYYSFLPDEVSKRLENAKSKEDAVKAFTEGEPDEKARLELLLKLFGCHNGSWDSKDQLEQLIDEMLESVSNDKIAEAARKAKDHRVTRGAARWIIGEKNYILPKKLQDELIPGFAAAGLTHPRDSVRKRTLFILAEINSKVSVAQIRKVFKGTYQVKALPEDEVDEPGGMRTFYPGGDEHMDCSDREYAAFLLCKIKDTDSYEAIKKFAGEVKGEKAKALLQKGLKLIGK